MLKDKFLIPSYILKESLPPIVISFAILSILVFCQHIPRNSEFIFSPIITWKISAQILLNLLPPIFTFTLPVALVLGNTLTISRLAADSEWFVLETSPLTYLPRLAPFLLSGIVGFAMLLTLNWNIGPQSISRIKALRSNLNLEQAASQIQPQIFNSQFPGHLLRINSVDRNTGNWEGVVLLKKDNASGKIQLLTAKSGSLTPNPSTTAFEIKLSYGIYIDNLTSVADHVTSAFKENTIRVLTTPQGANTDTAITSANQTAFTKMGVLFSQLKISKDSLIRGELELEIFKRLAHAFACIYAVCVALVLATSLRPRSTKRILSILVGFLLLVLYYTALTFGQNLAIKGKLPRQYGILLGFLIPSFVLLALFITLTNDRLRSLGFLNGHPVSPPQGSMASDDKVTGRNPSAYSTLRPPVFLQVGLGYYLILSEFAKYFILTIVILTITILLFTLLDIAPSLARNSIQFSYAVGYLINLSPQIVYYITPFAVLTAVTATATILARTGQLTILLFYSGHPARLVLPVLTAATGVLSLALYSSDSILPLANREQDYRYNKIKGKSLEGGGIAFDRLWTATSENSIYGYRLFQDNGQTQLNALIFRFDNPNYYLSEVTYIEKMPLDNNTTFVTANSSNSFRYLIGLDGMAKIETLNAGNIPDALKNKGAIYEKSYHEASKLTFQQLKGYIDQVERAGLSSTRLKLELMQKLAFPFACLTLFFVSLPICLLQIRRQYQSRSLAMAISISLALIFWAVLSVFEAAGKRGIIPITLAVWSPHALFLALAVTIQIRLHHS